MHLLAWKYPREIPEAGLFSGSRCSIQWVAEKEDPVAGREIRGLSISHRERV
jgi:hypothetical protein